VNLTVPFIIIPQCTVISNANPVVLNIILKSLD
jgi:hypothetical protein